jgi:hypothetical protein
LRACCIPQPRPGLLRSGDSPDPLPSRLVAGLCPLAVATHPLTGMPAATNEQVDFEALLNGPERSRRSVISLPRGRSPLRLSPPSGLRSPAMNPVPRVLRS